MLQYYIIDKDSEEIIEVVEFESEEQADQYELDNPNIYLDECLEEICFDDEYYDEDEYDVDDEEY